MGHILTGKEKTQQALRVNSLKTTLLDIKKEFFKKGAKFEKIQWLKEGFYINEVNFSLGSTIEYLLGYYSIQEAASQLPVEVMSPKPYEKILDMCAAPGGKTSQIAAWMKNKGVLAAIDSNRKRLYSLENHLERCGVINSIVYWGDSSEFNFGNDKFDRILLDAPCSGNYVTDSNWFKKRKLDDIKKNSENQKKLLKAAMYNIKQSGVIIYTTCSLEPEENEFNIQWLLENYPVKLELFEGPGSSGLKEIFGYKLNKELSKTMRFWPELTNTQGFYIAKVVKK